MIYFAPVNKKHNFSKQFITFFIIGNRKTVFKNILVQFIFFCYYQIYQLNKFYNYL